MKEKLYTAGEFANMAGVSLRTIRFYDSKGLLKPVSYSEAGYRYYDRNSLLVLQRIMMLKYLGFSLLQIDEILKRNEDTEEQIIGQKELLLQKRDKLDKLINTIDIWQNSKREEKWEVLLHLLHLMSDEEKVKEQYLTSDNLERRISIYDYGMAEESWANWVFRQMNIKRGDKILELGCGNGMLWCDNIRDLPEDMYLILTDRSEGMLSKTKKNLSVYEDILKEKRIIVEYRIMDANQLILPAMEYDCIIANHMLYHVTDREICLKRIEKALKQGGRLCCSTIGETHLKEMHDLVAGFDSRIDMPFRNTTRGFRLENGMEQLDKIFNLVTRIDFLNDLLVDDAKAVYDYVNSYPGNAAFVLEERGREFMDLLEKKIKKEGAIYIHGSTGIFICMKN